MPRPSEYPRRTPRVYVYVPLPVAERVRLDVVRFAHRRLLGERLTLARIMADGLDSWNARLRSVAASRGIAWERIEIDAHAYAAMRRRRREGRSSIDDADATPSATHRVAAAVGGSFAMVDDLRDNSERAM
ncbi:MAG: hypothetical protein AAGA55_11240 [Planctomycetota bacterium]